MNPQSSLPELLSDYLSEKIMKIINGFDSDTVSVLPAQSDSVSGITLSIIKSVTEVKVKHVITM